MKRFLGFLGWIGVLLVVAAVVLRFTRPDLAPWYQRLALGGLVVTALYTLSQWRDIARSFQGRNVKYGSIAATGVLVVLGILIAINWISNRQNKRWDLTAGGQFSLSDQTRQIRGGSGSAAGHQDVLRQQLDRVPGPARGVLLPVEAGHDGVRRRGEQPD